MKVRLELIYKKRDFLRTLIDIIDLEKKRLSENYIERLETKFISSY